MQGMTLDYEADGLAMQGWLAWDDAISGPRPGVLVFPALPGIGTQIRESAERLAAMGYAALACDLYGGGVFYDDLDIAVPLLAALRGRLDGVRARSRGAFDALRCQAMVDPARIAAIGYCFGGVMALELARDGADIAAAVGFHTPLRTARPQDAKNIKAAVLICTGSEDREANAEDRAAFEQEMRDGGVTDWRLSLYGNVYHSFTNPDADGYGKPDYARYDARAHRRSWTEMHHCLEEAFAREARP
jgi:dienelactone hydrolase